MHRQQGIEVVLDDVDGLALLERGVVLLAGVIPHHEDLTAFVPE